MINRALEGNDQEKPDLYGMDEEQRASLMKVLAAAETALDDWINTYASELCDEERVKEAIDRIDANGGTLAYIAQVLVGVRLAKKWLGE